MRLIDLYETASDDERHRIATAMWEQLYGDIDPAQPDWATLIQQVKNNPTLWSVHELKRLCYFLLNKPCPNRPNLTAKDVLGYISFNSQPARRKQLAKLKKANDSAEKELLNQMNKIDRSA